MSTLVERILGADAGVYVDRQVDRAYAHDGTGVLALEAWRQIGKNFPASPEKCAIIFDHIIPANNSVTATLQAELREFATREGMQFSDIGGGICHQVMGEGEVLPGEVIVGADSHTCTLGAFGAFATGVGATDLAAIWVSGATWFRVPGTIALHLTGHLEGTAEPKDLALAYVGMLGMDGATYRAIEFIGEGAGHIPMDGRLTVCNLSVEAGAKAGMFYADEVTCRYLARFGHTVLPQRQEEAEYEEVHEIDCGEVVPMVAIPPRVDMVRPVSECAGIGIDQVLVGTCTNGRYEDLCQFARIVRGKKVAVRTIVVPASRRVLEDAVRTGVLADILAAGCTVLPPGCGPCLGAHAGVLGEGEICLSTANRNFRNRMGVGGEIYLSSVATAAASSLTGVLTEPEEVS